ncbi:squalene-hopene/tetraprenyl-beta-curcumene cyclase [Hyphomicrobium facile]|uniref:Squalene-hopene/tetraprenyl-beta-curcumene cyclase n=2 Tax=Hyphomicrobium facile TaxID=51670 RepID=A0A1I7NKX1_9HYPH|nr:squalene--hopene cyclase [Hyphomicrobium facile]SFV35278.1 squalene-hopene/tetraprenyl-beta-curcumene cyclase [Hyphomicrobium facile]
MNFDSATHSARLPSDSAMREIATPDIENAITAAKKALLALQRDDGHFVFELEADATIPAEYVLMRHYLAEPVDAALEAKIANYLRRIQSENGGWPLFHDGASNISASVKAYYALKMIGVGTEEPYMKKARGWILSQGGASHANVFTRNLLALFGAIPWTGVPVMPVEIMVLPRWFPFHLDKISYWARTVVVPLTVLNALKPRARNPKAVGIPELFTIPPENVKVWPKGPHQKSPWSEIFGAIDRVLRFFEPYFPKSLRKRSIDKAVAFVDERLNGEDGLGAIFPAMVNSLLVYDALGYSHDHPNYVTARGSIEKLLMVKDDEAYCQPCLSPVWDTALSSHALMEVGDPQAEAAAARALQWLKPLQVLDTVGDWAASRPGIRPGGWAFQYANPHYPDTDDTAVVVMAMDRAQGRVEPNGEAYRESIARGREWIEGMQSKNGGWGAFDADNTYEYLNQIPFSDHGALLDPPTADVAARCVSMLAQLGERRGQSYVLDNAVAYLERTQEKDGSWYGRWGMNYIYGTWSVLCALNAAGVDPASSVVRKAVAWLLSIQNSDGGWGEDGESYSLDYKGYTPAPSTASQTSWALLALMAAGEVDNPAVQKGIAYLAATQGSDGFWAEKRFTATGFPRVFYLRYHGYPKFFPMWALARYRNLKASNTRSVMVGM